MLNSPNCPGTKNIFQDVATDDDKMVKTQNILPYGKKLQEFYALDYN